MYRSLGVIEKGDIVIFNEAGAYIMKAEWPLNIGGLYHGVALRTIQVGEFVRKNVDIKLTTLTQQHYEDEKRRKEKKLDKR